MRKIFIKSRARLDMLQIWLFIARDNVPTAIRVEAELESEIRDLAAQPSKGYRRAGLKNQRTRCWPFYSYLIFYQFNRDDLTVIRVLHGGRNIGKRIPTR